MPNNHTPTPWKAYCLGSEGYAIRPSFNKPLTELKQEYGSIHSAGFRDKVEVIANLHGDFERQKVNAEFIVKCISNHDKLVGLLIAIRYYYRAYPTNLPQFWQTAIEILQQIEKED